MMPNSSSRAELATIEATEGPAFSEPWQAQAFALVLALHEQGLFAWSEWAEYLTAAIADAQNKEREKRTGARATTNIGSLRSKG